MSNVHVTLTQAGMDAGAEQVVPCAAADGFQGASFGPFPLPAPPLVGLGFLLTATDAADMPLFHALATYEADGVDGASILVDLEDPYMFLDNSGGAAGVDISFDSARARPALTWG